MKKLNFIFFIAVYLLASCAAPPPQVTVTSEVTVTPPPISTPTLRPEFVAFQQAIADSGSRFTLGAGGLIYDGETPIPGMTVAPDGTISLSVNGETVTLDPADVDFDDEKGISIDGYKWDAAANDGEGAWVEAESAAMQQTNALIDQYHIDPETVTVTEAGGAVNVVDNETGTVLIRTIGERSKYDLEFALKTVAAHSCQQTDIIPGASGGVSPKSIDALNAYRDLLLPETSFRRVEGQMVYPLLVDEEKQCWAFTNGQDLAFRDENGVALNLALFEATEEKILELFYER